MAADLASAPTTAIKAQLCGDAHLSNFGAFASPERRLVFDVNDFDETRRARGSGTSSGWRRASRVPARLPAGRAGAGVVAGPRVMQATSDILLGWRRINGLDVYARSGDRIAIAAYLGGGDAFAAFAEAYADQDERDYAAPWNAVDSGRITAETGL